MLLGVTTIVGFRISYHLNQRPRHIRQLIDGLTILEAEMLYSQLSLQEAFFLVSRRLQEPTKSFFQQLSHELLKENINFIEQWNNQLEHFMYTSYLDDIDREILQQFGQTLGQHDYNQQEKNIHLTIKYLETQRDEALNQASQYGNMVKSLGFLLGLFIILLLI